ncbi:hypothetical protein CFBP5875_23820 (plasmid) [Agrobacterium pusense]|uniref:hypothetical protein n=1 Tax=Agrobacterium pusense TaxID=648995 RepID=UPI0010BF629A|nr:hypothetical protein [Agrobacterium pusense]QCL87648.1 hypothetical protein CFBP5875_23820 [Agrobacterium pusense]
MATLRYIGSGISTVVVNSKLTRRICDTPLENLTPADVYFGRGQTILLELSAINAYETELV